MTVQARLFSLYHMLDAHFGHEPHWWPVYSDMPQFEILVGAVLVQQTRWEMVEAAVVRLRDAGLLSPAALAAADTATLATLIRPCAFHSQKAPGLQRICRYLIDQYDGSVQALLAQLRAALRAELLALPRIGPETADTIMLYAAGQPVFVVDAYTRRLFQRVGVAPEFDFTRARYDDVQRLIEDACGDWALEVAEFALPQPFEDHQAARSGLYRNFHALITEACIHHCLASAPRCDQAGARRMFVDPRKCATHCLGCDGCPLRAQCGFYHSSKAVTVNGR